jgi:hypothetical protein
MEKQKYEREIEEILAKYDQESGRKERSERPTRPVGSYPPPPNRGGSPPKQVPSSSNFNWRRVSAGQYMLAAFGLAFLAVFLSRFSTLLSSLLVILAVVLFLIPIFLYWSGGTTNGGYSPNEQKRWRGQVIDFNTRRDITNDPFEGIKRWFRRR